MKKQPMYMIQALIDFHTKFGLAVGEDIGFREAELRAKLIEEESKETADAIRRRDMVEVADGLIDTLYVVFGTAVSFGIDLEPLWHEVHRTNMAKEGGGKRADGKILKPEGWQPPKILELLQAQGYKPTTVPPGVYKHYKTGDHYLVIGCGKNTSNGPSDGTPMVMYHKLASTISGHESSSNYELFTRSVVEFLEPVEWPDGQKRPRFCRDLDVRINSEACRRLTTG